MLKNKIKVLGAFGGKGVDMNNTCIQVTANIVIDAGNILKGIGEKASQINHIFLTHSHLDHIVDIPFLSDAYFEKRKKPITVYALKETIEHLNKYIFNWNIWPDFCEIDLIGQNSSAIKFVELKSNEQIEFEDCKIKAIKTNHTTSSCGYVITKNNNSLLFTSDTYRCDTIWEELNNNKNIKTLIIDVSFPSRLASLAKNSKHLTPNDLKEELKKLKRDDITIFINHLKPSYIKEIKEEILKLNILNGGDILADGDIIDLTKSTIQASLIHENEIKGHLSQLIEIGNLLTNEKDLNILIEKILLTAKNLSNADGGTLYLVNERELFFTVVQTDSLNIKMGGTQEKISWPSLSLYKQDNSANRQMVAVLCALENKLINIEDVYYEKGFDFSGTKKFDENTGYRTKSMLVVPLTNYDNEVIGVLQLLNKHDSKNRVISFTKEDEKLIKSMSFQAAISIENTRLIKSLEDLLNSFIKSIANAMGEKSYHTGGHIKKVAYIASLFAEEINKDTTIYKDVNYTITQLKEIETAAWLHDIGKITTPEHIIDKSTKLETIYDRVELIKAKIEVAKRDLEIELLKQKLSNTPKINLLEEKTQKEILKLQRDLDFICKINYGAYMSEEMKQRVVDISKRQISINNQKINLLSDDEIYNLNIQRGTLTEEEREIINNHVVVTYDMLNTLPFPKKLKRVPLIAGSHHKKVGGGGYGAKEIMHLPMSLEDKMLAIADVFEALTSNDRPYKKGNTLSKSMRILADMVKDKSLDKELMQFFVQKKLYLKFAHEFLIKEQIDEFDIDFSKL